MRCLTRQTASATCGMVAFANPPGHATPKIRCRTPDELGIALLHLHGRLANPKRHRDYLVKGHWVLKRGGVFRDKSLFPVLVSTRLITPTVSFLPHMGTCRQASFAPAASCARRTPCARSGISPPPEKLVRHRKAPPALVPNRIIHPSYVNSTKPSNT